LSVSRWAARIASVMSTAFALLASFTNAIGLIVWPALLWVSISRVRWLWLLLLVLTTALWRLARDHGFRPRPTCNSRWRENRKIGLAARKAIEADLAIPYSCKLTA
jgi:hypothetical protein